MTEQQITLCEEHKEEIVAFKQVEEDMEKIKLCLKCLANGQKRKVILIKEQIKNVQDMKSHLNSERQQQIQNNMQQLKELIENIQKLKGFYISQIESIDKVVETWKQKIQTMGDSFLVDVKKQEESDLQQFLSCVNELQNAQIKELSQYKMDIEKQLLLLKEPEILQTCNTILQDIHCIPNVIEKKTIVEEQDNNKVELNIFCEEHQQKRIKLLDLGKENKSSRRLACSQCLDNHPSLNYKTLNYAHSNWNKIVQKRQENMQRNLLAINGKVEQINQDVIQIQDSIKQSFDKNLQKLSKKFNQYKLDVDQITTEMNLQWQQLSTEEILNIVEQLSNIDQLSIFEDPLLAKYSSQENLVNKIMKDNLLYLQKCQLTQINKLNPLQQNQIFDEITSQFEKNKSNLVKTQKQEETNVQEEPIKESPSSSSIQKEEQTIIKFNNENFIYNLMKDSSIKVEQSCRAMAFNKDSSIILVGCNEQIHVYEFNQGMMKQIQILNEHEFNVITLNFMKKSNEFISGSDGDGLIIIWSLNSNNQWIVQQQLKKHSIGIRCLILNDNEDLFVSGGLDDKIIFWVKQNQWMVQQTIQQQNVHAISLNQQQNKLISCAQDNQILILKFQKQQKKWIVKQQKKWIVKQKIPVQQKGIRVQFIDNNLFTIQTYQNDLLDIYEMKNTNEYTKTKRIQVKHDQEDKSPFFPLQYIQSKRLLVYKNYQYINIIRIQDNGELIKQQSIEFQSSKLYGCMSDDGEYLVTWDEISKEIQIRQYEKL